MKSLIQQGEGVALEFKRRINHPKKIGKSLIAFANTLGGFLILGVDDNGFIYGVEDEKYPAEFIELISASECDPPVFCNVHSFRIDGKYVILIEIPESNKKPHFLKKENSAYIRVGDKSILASQVQLNLMRETVKPEVRVEFGEPERLLFDYLSSYGSITFQKFSVLSGLGEAESSVRLSRLISIGMIRSIYIDSTEHFSIV